MKTIKAAVAKAVRADGEITDPSPWAVIAIASALEAGPTDLEDCLDFLPDGCGLDGGDPRKVRADYVVARLEDQDLFESAAKQLVRLEVYTYPELQEARDRWHSNESHDGPPTSDDPSRNTE